MGGTDGSSCPAVEVLPTLRGLHGVLFEGSSIPDFVEGMRLESLEDPAETLLSPAVQDGLAFIPALLAPDAVMPSSMGHGGMKKNFSEPKNLNLAEPFLSDDKLAAAGIDVESMDKFRKEYLAFRAGDAGGASGEAVIVTTTVKPSPILSDMTSPSSKNASR